MWFYVSSFLNKYLIHFFLRQYASKLLWNTCPFTETWNQNRAKRCKDNGKKEWDCKMKKRNEKKTARERERDGVERCVDRAAAAAIKYYFRYFTISLVLFNGSLIVMIFKSRVLYIILSQNDSLLLFFFCCCCCCCCCFCCCCLESYILCVNHTRLNEVRYFTI